MNRDQIAEYAKTSTINMMEYLKSPEVTLTWQDLNVSLPDENAYSLTNLFNRSKSKLDEGQKQIINNVSGIAKPCEMLAIMGSSGSGKTTLLNVLTFRNRGALKISGNIKINGKTVDSIEKISAVSGYVQQDDLFVGTLKVKEHLLFQASLRMERNATKQQRIDRVNQVMMELNLKKCENQVIGNPERNMKGISGGERRRLAFASEILTNPSILFCDEPTSGLDSFMAMSIVECMRNLAEVGKTIIFTIHQPSNDLFEMFDKISFMCEGRMAYVGHRADVSSFFELQGYKCPENYSPPDFFIKTLSISPLDRKNCLETVDRIVDAFESSETYANMLDEIDNIDKSNSELSKIVSSKQHNNHHGKQDFIWSTVRQTRWLLWRNFKDGTRDPIAMRLLFFQTLIMSIIYSLVYFRIENNQEGIQNVNGVLFICLMNCAFGTLFCVLNTFPREIPLFVRETQNGIYRVLPYYLAKIMIELPNYVYTTSLFTGVIYWLTNLNPDPIRFFTCCGIMVITSQVALAYGHFISVIFPEKAALTDIAAPVTLPLMIFSGYLLNNDTIPKYFLWIKYISWFGYANEAAIINQWKGIKNITCDTDPSLCFFEGESVIHYFNMDEENFAFDIWMLVYLFVGWRVISYFGLLIKSYRR